MSLLTSVKLTKEQHRRRKQMPLTLVKLKAELGELQLFFTMQALEAATQAIGYELAEDYGKDAKS